MIRYNSPEPGSAAFKRLSPMRNIEPFVPSLPTSAPGVNCGAMTVGSDVPGLPLASNQLLPLKDHVPDDTESNQTFSPLAINSPESVQLLSAACTCKTVCETTVCPAAWIS